MLADNIVVQSFAKLHNLPHTLVVVCNNIFIRCFIKFMVEVNVLVII